MNTPPAKVLATGLAAVRIGVGGFGLVAPGAFVQIWTGLNRHSRQVRTIGFAVAARDLALGIGGLQAVRGGGNSALWLRCAALADAADFVATIKGFGALPRWRREPLVLAAAASAATAWWLAREADA